MVESSITWKLGVRKSGSLQSLNDRKGCVDGERQRMSEVVVKVHTD